MATPYTTATATIVCKHAVHEICGSVGNSQATFKFWSEKTEFSPLPWYSDKTSQLCIPVDCLSTAHVQKCDLSPLLPSFAPSNPGLFRERHMAILVFPSHIWISHKNGMNELKFSPYWTLAIPIRCMSTSIYKVCVHATTYILYVK